MKIAIDKRKIRCCLVCGIPWKERRGTSCWRRDKHIWSKEKSGVSEASVWRLIKTIDELIVKLYNENH